MQQNNLQRSSKGGLIIQFNFSLVQFLINGNLDIVHQLDTMNFRGLRQLVGQLGRFFSFRPVKVKQQGSIFKTVPISSHEWNKQMSNLDRLPELKGRDQDQDTFQTVAGKHPKDQAFMGKFDFESDQFTQQKQFDPLDFIQLVDNEQFPFYFDNSNILELTHKNHVMFFAPPRTGKTTALQTIQDFHSVILRAGKPDQERMKAMKEAFAKSTYAKISPSQYTRLQKYMHKCFPIKIKLDNNGWKGSQSVGGKISLAEGAFPQKLQQIRQQLRNVNSYDELRAKLEVIKQMARTEYHTDNLILLIDEINAPLDQFTQRYFNSKSEEEKKHIEKQYKELVTFISDVTKGDNYRCYITGSTPLYDYESPTINNFRILFEYQVYDMMLPTRESMFKQLFEMSKAAMTKSHADMITKEFNRFKKKGIEHVNLHYLFMYLQASNETKLFPGMENNVLIDQQLWTLLKTKGAFLKSIATSSLQPEGCYVDVSQGKNSFLNYMKNYPKLTLMEIATFMSKKCLLISIQNSQKSLQFVAREPSKIKNLLIWIESKLTMGQMDRILAIKGSFSVDQFIRDGTIFFPKFYEFYQQNKKKYLNEAQCHSHSNTLLDLIAVERSMTVETQVPVIRTRRTNPFQKPPSDQKKEVIIKDTKAYIDTQIIIWDQERDIQHVKIFQWKKEKSVYGQYNAILQILDGSSQRHRTLQQICEFKGLDKQTNQIQTIIDYFDEEQKKSIINCSYMTPLLKDFKENTKFTELHIQLIGINFTWKKWEKMKEKDGVDQLLASLWVIAIKEGKQIKLDLKENKRKIQ